MSSSGSIGASSGVSLEPAQSTTFFRVCNSLALDGGFTSNPSYSDIVTISATAPWGTYTPGSFTRSRVLTPISAVSLASTSIRGFLYGSGLGFRFTDLQTKSNLYKFKPNGFSITIS